MQTFQTWNRANILASLTMKLSYAGEMLETNLDSTSQQTPHTASIAHQIGRGLKSDKIDNEGENEDDSCNLYLPTSQKSLFYGLGFKPNVPNGLALYQDLQNYIMPGLFRVGFSKGGCKM